MPWEDSNLQVQVQSLSCCLYTTRQICLAVMTGFEPAISCVTGRRLNTLVHTTVGVIDETRTRTYKVHNLAVYRWPTITMHSNYTTNNNLVSRGFWCGRRDSNSQLKLGRLTCCQLTPLPQIVSRDCLHPRLGILRVRRGRPRSSPRLGKHRTLWQSRCHPSTSVSSSVYPRPLPCSSEGLSSVAVFPLASNNSLIM